jgi:hypothetical protein
LAFQPYEPRASGFLNSTAFSQVTSKLKDRQEMLQLHLVAWNDL